MLQHWLRAVDDRTVPNKLGRVLRLKVLHTNKMNLQNKPIVVRVDSAALNLYIQCRLNDVEKMSPMTIGA